MDKAKESKQTNKQTNKQIKMFTLTFESYNVTLNKSGSLSLTHTQTHTHAASQSDRKAIICSRHTDSLSHGMKLELKLSFPEYVAP